MSLAVTYSHMGRPHTTIGAGRLHFRVRDGIGWFPSAMAARQTSTRSIERKIWIDPRFAPNSLGVIWSSLTGN